MVAAAMAIQVVLEASHLGGKLHQDIDVSSLTASRKGVARHLQRPMVLWL